MSISSLDISAIAARYAGALFSLAEEEGSLDAVAGYLGTFLALLKEDADIARFIENPIVSVHDHVESVRIIIDKLNISGIAANLIFLLAENNRLFVFRRIVEEYQSLLLKKRGVIQVDVVVASILSSGERGELLTLLKNKVGEGVVFSEKVDPSILGGIIIKIGSYVVDSSLKTKLAAMKFAIKNV